MYVHIIYRRIKCSYIYNIDNIMYCNILYETDRYMYVLDIGLKQVEEEMAYKILKHLMWDRGCRKQYRKDLDELQVRII